VSTRGPQPMRIDIPLRYLFADASDRTLGEYQLKHLSLYSNFKKEARLAIEKAIDEAVAAAFAVYIREHRRELIELCKAEGREKEAIDV